MSYRARIQFDTSVPDREPGRPVIDSSALVGCAPQARGWSSTDDYYRPFFGVDCRVGALTCIDSGCESPTRVGDRSWIMKQVHVAHDCVIGADVEVASGSVLLGYAQVGDGSKIGGNVTILPYRKVGAGCVIGAGSVVTKDVPDGETWCGNPARPLERNPVPFTERVRPD